jgi:Fic family protein
MDTQSPQHQDTINRYAREISARANRLPRKKVQIGNRLLDKVRTVLFRQDGPKTVAEIAREVGASEASVSARLRDLRKPAYGEWNIFRVWSPSIGAYTYRIGA